jgi:AcrR family transcriptional regulator
MNGVHISPDCDRMRANETLQINPPAMVNLQEAPMTEAPYREKMRETMLTIANRIVATEGLSALQARRISQEAGCAVGTLYNIFGGLDYLIIEANASTLDELSRALTLANASARGSILNDQLLALATAYLRFANDRNRSWRAVFEHHMSPGSDVPIWYRDRQGALFALVEGQLAPVMADVTARHSAARALFSAVHGIVAISLDSKLGDFDFDEAERQVKFIVDAVAKGLRTAPARDDA